MSLHKSCTTGKLDYFAIRLKKPDGSQYSPDRFQASCHLIDLFKNKGDADYIVKRDLKECNDQNAEVVSIRIVEREE